MTLTIRRSIPSGWWFTLRRKGRTTYAWEVVSIADGFHSVARKFWEELRPFTCRGASCPPMSDLSVCQGDRRRHPAILCDICRGRFNFAPLHVRAWRTLRAALARRNP